MKLKISSGFTLVEMLIAISIFATISVLVGSLYVQTFKETKQANVQNQIYNDARYVLDRIAEEIRSGAIDYDEYYNQYVVIPTKGSGNYGQAFGTYYSSFFNPGTDEWLGFDCDDAANGGSEYVAADNINNPTRSSRRNLRDCVILRQTIDRHTGANPYVGKTGQAGASENAFCGTLRYKRNRNLDNRSITAVDDNRALPNNLCSGANAPMQSEMPLVPELYLISADGKTKTMLARERIGGADATPSYALSLLRMSGSDTNADGVVNAFACVAADGFVCGPCGLDDAPADVPRERNVELNPPNMATDLCDTKENGFSRDFVPISPLRVTVTNLQFIITPLEDPHYAFSEANQSNQPGVKILLTVEANPDYGIAGGTFLPITFTKTVSSQSTRGITAPLVTPDP